MTELLNIRRGSGDLALPGRPLPVLPLSVDAALHSEDATWCGDFSTPSYGFGHVKALRRPPLPGAFELGGDTLQLMVVCDGFHRGTLADPGLRVMMVLSPGGLSELTPDQVDESALAHAELDVLTRPAYTWRHPVATGRAPELQLAALNLRVQDLEAIAGEAGDLEAYIVIEAPRGQSYVNLDGTPGHNFRIAAKLFRSTAAQKA